MSVPFKLKNVYNQHTITNRTQILNRLQSFNKLNNAQTLLLHIRKKKQKKNLTLAIE